MNVLCVVELFKSFLLSLFYVFVYLSKTCQTNRNPYTSHTSHYTHCTMHTSHYTHCTTHTSHYTHCTTYSSHYTHCTTHTTHTTHHTHTVRIYFPIPTHSKGTSKANNLTEFQSSSESGSGK